MKVHHALTSSSRAARRARSSRRRPLQLEGLEGRQLLTTWAYDFGPATSPVAAGYTAVSQQATYDATRGYGWTSFGVQARDRRVGSTLQRDFAMAELGRLGFATDVPDGSYVVTLTMGDAAYAHGPAAVWLEGQQVDTASTARGEFVQKTYRTTVTDGRLDLELRGVEGNQVVSVGAMSVVAADSIPPSESDPTLISEGFEDADLRSRGWYDGSRWRLGAGATGQHSLQYTFRAGGITPEEQVARHLFSGTESVHLSFDFKVSSDWTWTPNSHLFYFLTNADGPFKGPASTHLTLYTEAFRGSLRLAAQDLSNASLPHGPTQVRTNPHHLRNAVSPEVVFQPGRWYHVEAEFQLNSLDLRNDRPNPDGEVHAWVNGQQVISRTDVIYRTTDFPEMKINQLLIGPYMHGGVAHDQELWIDNLTVATERPTA
jgi:hypothetical protein